MNNREKLKKVLGQTNSLIETMEYAMCPERPGIEDRQKALTETLAQRDEIIKFLEKQDGNENN